MRIQIKSVSSPVKDGNFFKFDAKYTDLKQNKEFTRKVVSFGSGEAAYKALKDAVEGEIYDVKLTKDDNGYWQWEDVSKGAAGAAASQGGGGSTSDARRQVLIVRQNSITNAVAAAGAGATVQAILDTAANFEEWVNRGVNMAAKNAVRYIGLYAYGSTDIEEATVVARLSDVDEADYIIKVNLKNFKRYVKTKPDAEITI